MGFELAQKVLRNRLPVTPNEKLLLAMLADRIDHKGYCYPSVARLASESGLSTRHVIRCLKSLCVLNVIVIHRIAGTNSEYNIIEEVLNALIHKTGTGNSHGGVLTHSQTLKNESAKHTPDIEAQEKSKKKPKEPKKKSKEPKSGSKGKPGGDTQSGGGVTDRQGGSDPESGEGCHTVSLIDKPIKKLKIKIKKAKPSAIANPKKQMIDGVEIVSGEPVMIGMDLGQGESFTAVQVMQKGKLMNIEQEPIHHFDKYSDLIETFGHLQNGESSSFIYHMLEAVETLDQGQCYNIVTENVPVELIKLCQKWLEAKGFKTDYLHAKDQYIKIYKPKQNTPMTHLIPSLHSMSSVMKTTNESLKAFQKAFKLPSNAMMGGPLIGPKLGDHVHIELKPGELAKFETVNVPMSKHPLKMKVIDDNGSIEYEGETVDVDQINEMVKNGLTNLKPAKATPISTWRLAVLEWRNENDIQGALMKSTQKDAGMLNQAKKKYGAGFEYGMTHAVLQWDKFVTYANLNTGGKSKPAQPSISYFVLCIDNVKLFLNKKSDTKVKLKQPIKLKVTKKVLKEGKSKTQKLLAAVKAQEENDES